jgi:ribosomal protein S18 acetylase RimI-like enzyme
MTIRPAEPRDVPALGRLGASLMRIHHAFDQRRFLPPGDNPEQGYASFLETQMRAKDTLVLVAERKAAGGPPQIVGYAYAAVEPLSWKELRDRAGFIHDLLVADAARGAGVGQRLLDAAVDWLREQGMPRVVLWTAAPNDLARRLFEARGFKPTMVEMTLELGAPHERPR